MPSLPGEPGGILAGSVIRRAWRSARKAVLPPRGFEPPTGRCGYGNRDTRPTRWLGDGIPPLRVAEWAGNGVVVPLAICARCVEGRLPGLRGRTEAAGDLPRRPSEGRPLDRNGASPCPDTHPDQQKALPDGRAETGAPGRTRTCGQALRRRLLYPLSYGGRWVASCLVPWCGPIRDVAGDKDRAPGSLTLPLRLRGSMWRFGEAVLIIAGKCESCIAFGVCRTGCCALVMPGQCPCPGRPVCPICSVGAQTCPYASEFP
ncbi:hypothetical protein GCM10010521_11180 [Streptomyces rameus]|uniref:Uncharacterized protein n=1 Tax=Streptomyces rameus TaxID=68261 RepID=A0ABP6MW90_9ACTN